MIHQSIANRLEIVLTKYSVGDVEFEVPSSWTVKDVDGTIEILQQEAGGAMHVSFLKRSLAPPPRDDEARLLLDNFASNNGLVCEDLIATTSTAKEARAKGKFQPGIPSVDAPLHWLLASVVWQDRAVRISYCTDVASEESLRAADGVINSIRRVHS